MSRGQIQSQPAERVYRLLGTRPEGLERREVEERARDVGPNVLKPPLRFRWLESLGRQFTNFFSVLLDVSAVICFVAHHTQPGEGMDVLGWALLCVSALNAVFAFVQEYRAERAMAALQKYLPAMVRVQRGGREARIPAEELVPGDVMLVADGDRIAADARLVQGHDVMVNNAPLTGEAHSVPLTAGAVEAPLTESPNILFAGCQVLRGTGTAVVFSVGRRTEFGKIASLSRDIKRPRSPLENETARMVRTLTAIAVGMGTAFFCWGVLTGRPVWVNLVFMLGIIVANVPEGLLPTFTLSLAMASVRMARHNVLVKGLNSVESLGSVRTICTDKTGTLTRNELSVAALVDGLEGDELRGAPRRALVELALVASEVRRGSAKLHGDPLDVAIAELHQGDGGSVEEISNGTRTRFAFDLEKRRAGGVLARDGRRVFVVKGAWEALRPMLTAIARRDGTAVAADESALARTEQVVRRLASRGMRVIAVAHRELDAGSDEEQDGLERGLVLAGLLGTTDPLRPEVPPAVASCHRAGIRVVLVTGDHPVTAVAVAREAGILPPDEEESGHRVVTGADLALLREEGLVERLRGGALVFARTTPEQKMKIVGALQRMGDVVGMTGDGVNDAPALKAADVGIAMGASGTDVAREAAQVILLDDNFASIVAGVGEGRTVYRNIRKFTNYVLVSNGPEILPYLLYILLPVPLALPILHILSIDLGTDIVPSMALGQEPPDPDVLDGPLPRGGVRLLTGKVIAHSYLFLGLIQALYSLGLFFLVLHEGGWTYGAEIATADPVYRSATGIALSSIILMQIGNFVGRRSHRGSGIDIGLLRNRLTVLGFALEILFSWAVLYAAPVRDALGTGPVRPSVYALAWLGIPLIYLADLARKRIATAIERRRPRATD